MKTSPDMTEKLLPGTLRIKPTKMMYNSILRIEYIYVMPCKWNLKAVQALENLFKDLDILKNDIEKQFSFFAHCGWVGGLGR